MNRVKFEEKDHTYYDDADKEYVSVSRILEYFGISQIDKLKAIHGEEHFAALALFGKEVHKLTAAEDRHELNKWKFDKRLDPYIEGWCSFRHQVNLNKGFLAIEDPLLSKVWGFAGTPDRIVDRGTFLEIPDLKCGCETVAEKIQTALYAILAEENYGKPVKARYTVHLDPKKALGYQVIPHNNKNDINVAKSLMVVWNYKKEKGLL